jgi:hypothetical protein
MNSQDGQCLFFSWLGMETVGGRILTRLGVRNLPYDVLSLSWSWQSLLLEVLTLFAAARLTLYVLEGVQADAKKDSA